MGIDAGFPEAFIHTAHAGRGALSPRKFVGAGQHPEGPQVRGRGGDRSEIVRILRKGGPPKYIDYGGYVWTIGKRKGTGGVRDE